MSWKGDYVRYRSILDRIKEHDSSSNAISAPPLSLIFAKDHYGKLQISKKARTEAVGRAAALAATHLGGIHPPDFADPTMQAGLQEWVGAELQRAVDQLSGTLAEVRFSDQLITALSGRPGEQRKVMRRKARLQAACRTFFFYLHDWGEWAARVEQLGFVEGWVPGKLFTVSTGGHSGTAFTIQSTCMAC